MVVDPEDLFGDGRPRCVKRALRIPRIRGATAAGSAARRLGTVERVFGGVDSARVRTRSWRRRPGAERPLEQKHGVRDVDDAVVVGVGGVAAAGALSFIEQAADQFRQIAKDKKFVQVNTLNEDRQCFVTFIDGTRVDCLVAAKEENGNWTVLTLEGETKEYPGTLIQ